MRFECDRMKRNGRWCERREGSLLIETMARGTWMKVILRSLIDNDAAPLSGNSRIFHVALVLYAFVRQVKSITSWKAANR